jgi:enamine deaminase RidA (YjgF/YER057c/UK114 family)
LIGKGTESLVIGLLSTRAVPEFVDQQKGRVMKMPMGMLSGGLLALLAASGSAQAQSTVGAEARLKEKNIILPAEPQPAANYVNAVRVGNLLFMAGNNSGPQWTIRGKLGKDLTVEQGYQAARQAGMIMLSKVQAVLGSLDRVKRVVTVFGMVNSAEGFLDAPKVINGFSDLMVEVFGEQGGKHARSAVGVAALEGNFPVEVEMVIEVE